MIKVINNITGAIVAEYVVSDEAIAEEVATKLNRNVPNESDVYYVVINTGDTDCRRS